MEKIRHRACEPASARSGVSQGPVSAALWALGLTVLRGLEGELPGVTRGYPEFTGPLFFDHFFDTLLGPCFFRLWSQLGSNLAFKIDPKSVQEPSKMHSNLYLIFDTLLDRFLVGFGSNLEAKTTKNPSRNQSRSFPTS